jgi:hypothetical protein
MIDLEIRPERTDLKVRPAEPWDEATRGLMRAGMADLARITGGTLSVCLA